MRDSTVKGSMFDYAVTIDEVERLTGHDFFYNLPDEIEMQIESQIKVKDWM